MLINWFSNREKEAKRLNFKIQHYSQTYGQEKWLGLRLKSNPDFLFLFSFSCTFSSPLSHSWQASENRDRSRYSSVYSLKMKCLQDAQAVCRDPHHVLWGFFLANKDLCFDCPRWMQNHTAGLSGMVFSREVTCDDYHVQIHSCRDLQLSHQAFRITYASCWKFLFTCNHPLSVFITFLTYQRKTWRTQSSPVMKNGWLKIQTN